MVDKKQRFDEENHMNFKYWSLYTEDDAPSATQKIIYTNDSKADMTFNLSVNGPFEIVKTKSNTGAKHPLAVAQTPSKRKHICSDSPFSCEAKGRNHVLSSALENS